MSYTVGYFVGSLSSTSINRKLAEALVKLAPEGVEFKEIPIKDLPLYSQDYDADYPAEGKALKDAIASSDAILFVTPEYNRSIPGVLKNAIDTASRPYGDNAFDGKPAAVTGASIGAIGSALAQQHLRNVLSYLDMPQIGQPEMFIQWKEGLVKDGAIGPDSKDFVQKYVDTFAAWVKKQVG